MEEEGITVPSFRGLPTPFQGSRTFSTGPNSKVIAPIPISTRNPRDALREIAKQPITSQFVHQYVSFDFTRV